VLQDDLLAPAAVDALPRGDTLAGALYGSQGTRAQGVGVRAARERAGRGQAGGLSQWPGPGGWEPKRARAGEFH